MLFRFWILLIILVPVALITALSLSNRVIPLVGVDFYVFQYVAFLLLFLWLLLSPVVLLRFIKTNIKSSKSDSSEQRGLNLDKVLKISVVSFVISFPLFLFSIYFYSSYYLNDTGTNVTTMVGLFAVSTVILVFLCLLSFITIVSGFLIKLKRMIFKPKAQSPLVAENPQISLPVPPQNPQI
jgi:hypothetical protein